MSPGAIPDFAIDECRLWKSILQSSTIGNISGTTGMNRLALSPSDKAMRDLFVQQAESIGCRVIVDKIGNIFAILPGLDNTLPPIGMGSHLDTQPNGGRFDGVLGVLGALEVLQTFKDNQIITRRPIAVINWTNEEGARFESGCTGSAVWSGHVTLQHGYDLKSNDGYSTLHEELTKIEYLGDQPADHQQNPLSAHLELHIEQGSRLEKSGSHLAIVSRIQGNRRFRVSVQGQKAHSGATPMNERSDALVVAARAILRIQEIGIIHAGFATVGILECENGSINCIPGDVTFCIDLRHPRRGLLDKMEQDVRDYLCSMEAADPNLQVEVDKIWESPAAEFSEIVLRCFRESVQEGHETDRTLELDSFAGHDSAMTQLCVPTGMIFVPSCNGISHSPLEFTSSADCAYGVQILAESILRLDSALDTTFGRKDSGSLLTTEETLTSQDDRIDGVREVYDSLVD